MPTPRPTTYLPRRAAGGGLLLALAAALCMPPAAQAAEGDVLVASRSETAAPAHRQALASVRDLLAQRRWSDAEQRLWSLQAAHPTDGDVGTLLGVVLRRTGKVRQATEVLEQTLQSQPRHRAARETLGTLYLLNREPAKAIDQLEMLRQICVSPCAEARNLSEAIASYSP